MGALAVQRVGGDQDIVQVGDGVEHRHEGGQLSCTDHLGLGQGQVLGVA